MADENDAHNLDALQRAVNDCARDVSVLWSSFTLLGVYLLVAAGSVTSRDLFLDKPVLLPILNVSLPVDGFFAVAPVLYVASHIYLLLQLLRMFEKLTAWQRLLQQAVPSPDDRKMLILRLTDFPFLRFLAEGELGHTLIFRMVLLSVSFLTLSLLPAIVLLQMQLAFLAYHLAPVTWLHRTGLVVDFLLGWYFWFALHWRRRVGAIELLLYLPGAVMTTTILLFGLFLAVYPGEPVYDNAFRQFADYVASAFMSDGGDRPLTAWLFEGDVNTATGRTSSVFANRIILVGDSFYDGTHKDGTFSISLRGRDLRQAVLNDSDLRYADFRGADLSLANLSGTRLDGAHFECKGTITPEHPTENREAVAADEQGVVRLLLRRVAPIAPATMRWKIKPTPDKRCTKLNGTVFSGAQAGAAVFDFVSFNATNFVDADLTGASFKGANLKAVAFERANLQNATFAGADLAGQCLGLPRPASDAKATMAFNNTACKPETDPPPATSQSVRAAARFSAAPDLDGANFDNANLRGASLNGASLLGASLRGTELDDADLGNTRLNGASFAGASLKRAWFTDATLVAASFDQAEAGGANFDSADLRAANLLTATLSGARLAGSKLQFAMFDESMLAGLDLQSANGADASIALPAAAAGLAVAQKSQTDARKMRKPAKSAAPPATKPAGPSAPSQKSADGQLKLLTSEMCELAHAPFVARALIKEGRFAGVSPDSLKMIATLRDPAACMAAKLLSDDDMAALDRIEDALRRNPALTLQ